jgi:hypothetical protein
VKGKEFELILKPRGEWDVGKGRVLKIGTADARLVGDEYRFEVLNETNGTERYWLMLMRTSLDMLMTKRLGC